MKLSILLTLLVFVSGCTTVPITGRKQLSIYTDTEVLALSNQEYTSYMKSAVLSTNTTQAAMVLRCGEKIKNAVELYFRSQGRELELSSYAWEFKLVNDKAPNAFCMPGGKVVVYEGILPYTASEDGLAVVMGHEIAHAIAKHSNERISQQLALQTGGEFLNVLIGNASSNTQSVVSSLYGLGSNLGVMLPFSRKQEYEADKLGLIFMTMAGYNPEEAIHFWSRMSTQGGSAPLEFMSTHPADENRIAYITSILPEVMTYKK